MAFFCRRNLKWFRSADADLRFRRARFRPTEVAALVLLLLALIAPGIFGVHLTAQNRVVPVLKQAEVPINPECRSAIDLVGRLLGKYPHPQDWTWYVACDEKTWEALQRHLGMAELSNRNVIYASTSLRLSSTYLRGATLIQQYSFLPSADHVIAHELAHIYLHSRDEIRVDDLALQWLREKGLTDRPAYTDLRAGR